MSVRDIDTPWGSHKDSLAAALATLEPGALVIEHGAGMYSSPLIARHDVRVICIEELPGWTGWARWLYTSAGRQIETLERAKLAIPHLASAALVFIDGAARERGDLLKWSLDAGAPLILCHDTESDHRSMYGYAGHYFERRGYTMTDDSARTTSESWRPTTTTWRRNP